MKLKIIQDDTDCINYLADIGNFIAHKHPSISQEEFESRFDAILTEYAMDKEKQGYDASYDTATRTLTIFS